MFTAYDSDFTPPSSHGAPALVSVAKPVVAVSTRTPSRRSRSDLAPIGSTVAKTVSGPPGSTPRVTDIRSAPSQPAGHA